MTGAADGVPGRPTSKSRLSTARAELKARQAAGGSHIADELTGKRQDLTPTENRADEIPFASLIRLTLDQVEPYEKNPRHQDNDHEAEIEASIEVRGLEQRLVVTRRPWESHHVLAAGGGTRYRSLKRLWEKTGNRKFFEMDFELRPYVSESHLQAAHLSENLHRADMCFWDKANGIMDLKAELEAELGHPLTPVEAIAEFNAIGLPGTGSSNMSLYAFAVEHMPPLGATAPEITGLAVKTTLNPGYNAIQALAVRVGITDFEARIWAPTLANFDEERRKFVLTFRPSTPGEKAPAISWGDLLAETHSALADDLQVPPEAIPRMIAMLQIAKDTSREELLALALPPGANDSGPEDAPETAPPSLGNHTGETETDAYLPGHRAQSPRMPGVFAAVSPAAIGDDETGNLDAAGPSGMDEDRPPESAVAEKEAQRRQQLQQAREQERLNRDTGQLPAKHQPPSATLEDAVEGALAQSTTPGIPATIEKQKDTVRSLATQLASHSKTLAGNIIANPALPMGWMIDIPAEVLDGTPLGPQPKQIFWLLTRASFQLNVAVDMGKRERMSDTRFAEFLDTLPLTDPEAQARWTLLRPADGFEFLVTWLLDPAYAHLGNLASQILTVTKELVASHPTAFTELNHALDFQDLQLDHQAQRRQADLDDLTYCCLHGATQEMVRSWFPYGNTTGLRLKPGRIAPLDLGTHQFHVFKLWRELQLQAIPSEKGRVIALHRALAKDFPSEEISLASLYQAVLGEG